MSDIHLFLIGLYLLIGYLISDTLLVKMDNTYWLVMLLYPIAIVAFVLTVMFLKLAIKYYEAKEWLG